jgi:cytochrome c oxidase subunit 4
MSHSSHSGHADAHGEHHHHPHLIPFQLYVTVLVTLLILTVITVAVSRVDFGNWNIVVAMLIASVKAGTVGLFFMHLKYENPLIWLYVVFPIVLVGIMLGGLFIDNPNRTDPKIYIPAAAGAAAGHGAEGGHAAEGGAHH